MKATKPQTEQKSHKVPKKKKSLWELANESTVPEELKILAKILEPHEIRETNR